MQEKRAEAEWRAQLQHSLLSTARALGLHLPDDDSSDWIMVTAGAIQSRVESMTPPGWVVHHQESAEGETLWRCTGCNVHSVTPDEHECHRPGPGPRTELEARIMSEAATAIHNRMVERLDALPWWRVGLRRGLSLALLDAGGAAFEWEADAKRLAEDSASADR